MRFYGKVARSAGAEALLTRVLPELERAASYDLRGDWSGTAPGCGLPGMYLIERGTLSFAPGSQRCDLGAGDVLLMPAASAHRIGNRSHSPAEPMTTLLEGARPVDGWQRVGEGRSVQLHTLLLEPRPLPRLAGLPPWLPLPRANQPSSLRHVVDALRKQLEPGAGHPEVVRLLTRALWLEALRPSLGDARLDRAMLELAEWAEQYIETLEHVDQLARFAGLSRSRLHERFQACHGVAPMTWIRTQRMKHARRLLDQQGLSVAQVADRLGYASESAFRKAYRRTLGIPARARR